MGGLRGHRPRRVHHRLPGGLAGHRADRGARVRQRPRSATWPTASSSRSCPARSGWSSTTRSTRATIGPAEDRHRVHQLRGTAAAAADHGVAAARSCPRDRLADLGDLVVIRYVLDGRDRLEELTPYLVRGGPPPRPDHAGAAGGRRSPPSCGRRCGAPTGWPARMTPTSARRADEHLMALDSQLQVRPPGGPGLRRTR